MSTAKKLALIAAGYVLAVAFGIAAVALHELFLSSDVAQASGGMAAFGDMILFVLVAGFLSLAPTGFLLTLLIEKAPRTALIILLVIAAVGPPSWLMIGNWVSPGVEGLPQPGRELLDWLVVFGAMPRIVVGPVLLVAEGVAFLLLRGRVTRVLLAAAMLMDVVPLGWFALHVAMATLS